MFYDDEKLEGLDADNFIKTIGGHSVGRLIENKDLSDCEFSFLRKLSEDFLDYLTRISEE